MSAPMSKPNTNLLLKFESQEDRDWFIKTCLGNYLEDYIEITEFPTRRPLEYKVTVIHEDWYEKEVADAYRDHEDW